jgi:predicted DNA-binding transcriptional regulator AlpA
MSNRVINQSAVSVSTLAMRAKAPVFGTEDRLHENRVGGISEESLYSPHSTNLDLRALASDHSWYPIGSTDRLQSIEAHGSDRLLNARQVAAKLGVSERWVRDHTTRRSPRIRGLKMGSLMRYRLADVEAFLAELDTQPSSRPSRFRV